MNEEKKIFFTGCFLILCGVLCVTVLPVIIDLYVQNVILSTTQYRVMSLVFFAGGTFAYVLSYTYYKFQLYWILFLFIFYNVFQILFQYIRNLGA